MCLNYNAAEFINIVFGLGPLVLIGISRRKIMVSLFLAEETNLKEESNLSIRKVLELRMNFRCVDFLFLTTLHLWVVKKK